MKTLQAQYDPRSKYENGLWHVYEAIMGQWRLASARETERFDTLDRLFTMQDQ
jgi:hypothetical protein